MKNTNFPKLNRILKDCPISELRAESLEMLKQHDEQYKVSGPIPLNEYIDILRKRSKLGGSESAYGIDRQIQFMQKHDFSSVLIHTINIPNQNLTIVTDQEVKHANYIFIRRPKVVKSQDHDMVWKAYEGGN